MLRGWRPSLLGWRPSPLGPIGRGAIALRLEAVAGCESNLGTCFDWVKSEDYSDAGHAVCNKLCNVWTLLEQPPIITTVANVGKLKQLNLMELICVISREEYLRPNMKAMRTC